MEKILTRTIKDLLKRLSYSKEEEKELAQKLSVAIKDETLREIGEGLHSKAPRTLTECEKILGLNKTAAVLEMAASRILVNFYAKEKKQYTEQQREIFLTFLLTNKMQRELKTLTS